MRWLETCSGTRRLCVTDGYGLLRGRLTCTVPCRVSELRTGKGRGMLWVLCFMGCFGPTSTCPPTSTFLSHFSLCSVLISKLPPLRPTPCSRAPHAARTNSRPMSSQHEQDDTDDLYFFHEGSKNHVKFLLCQFWMLIGIGGCLLAAYQNATGTGKHATPVWHDRMLWWQMEQPSELRIKQRSPQLLLLVLGCVYEVTRGNQYYAEGMEYNGYCRGTDVTKAYLSADFEKDGTDDLSTLSPAECLGVDHWSKFYEEKSASGDYPLVAKHVGREDAAPTSQPSCSGRAFRSRGLSLAPHRALLAGLYTPKGEPAAALIAFRECLAQGEAIQAAHAARAASAPNCSRTPAAPSTARRGVHHAASLSARLARAPARCNPLGPRTLACSLARTHARTHLRVRTPQARGSSLNTPHLSCRDAPARRGRRSAASACSHRPPARASISRGGRARACRRRGSARPTGSGCARAVLALAARVPRPRHRTPRAFRTAAAAAVARRAPPACQPRRRIWTQNGAAKTTTSRAVRARAARADGRRGHPAPSPLRPPSRHFPDSSRRPQRPADSLPCRSQRPKSIQTACWTSVAARCAPGSHQAATRARAAARHGYPEHASSCGVNGVP